MAKARKSKASAATEAAPLDTVATEAAPLDTVATEADNVEAQAERAAIASESATVEAPPAPTVAELLIANANAIKEEEAKSARLEAERAKNQAIANLEASKNTIALEWAAHDTAARSWLYVAGKHISAFVADYCALHGLAKRSDAVSEVVDSINRATNDDYGQDASRCIAIYHAAQIFGVSTIVNLPINAQRAAALLIDRVKSADGSRESWLIPESLRSRAPYIVALATTDLPDAPHHIKARIRRGKDGAANGIDIYNLARDMSHFVANRKGAVDPFAIPTADQGKNSSPLDNETTPPTTPPTTKTVEGGATVTTKEVEASTTTTTKEGAALAPTVKAQDATAMRADGSDGATVAIKLDHKPAIAAVQILEALANMGNDSSDKPNSVAVLRAMAANDERFTFDNFLSPLIEGLSVSGRTNVLKMVALKVAREIKVGEYLKANANATRENALKAIANAAK